MGGGGGGGGGLGKNLCNVAPLSALFYPPPPPRTSTHSHTYTHTHTHIHPSTHTVRSGLPMQLPRAGGMV